MENYQNQFCATQQTYGNPAPQTTDELGNTLVLQPIDELGNSTYKQTGEATGIPGYNAGNDHGMLASSHSSDSNSEKTMETLRETHANQQTDDTTTFGGEISGETHEKKGLMERIKDKLHHSH